MPPALILTLDAAGDGCSAAVVAGGAVLASRQRDGGRGSSAVLPEMVRQVLDEAGVEAPGLCRIAVTVGPGSFTGVRAAIALAQGIGLAAGVPVVGVTLGAAIRAEAGACPRPIWVAVDSRRGRVFLDIDGVVQSLVLTELPGLVGPVAVAGDAAEAVGAVLGGDVMVLPIGGAGPLGIALAALMHGGVAVPLYVDPVEARPGAAARPAPV